jgi:hypothetical protein
MNIQLSNLTNGQVLETILKVNLKLLNIWIVDKHNKNPKDGKYDRQIQKIDETITRLWLASDDDEERDSLSF